MPLAEFDTGIGYSFKVELDGVQLPSVMEVSGLKREVDKIEVKENTADGKFVIRNMPGRYKAGEITVTRGLNELKSGEDWLKKAMQGQVSDIRKNGAVTILDHTGANVVRRYNLLNMWVKSVEAGTLKAGDTSPLTEKWTICFEDIQPD
ncbi:MAG: phage tail protein [Actinomycetota bacterium]